MERSRLLWCTKPLAFSKVPGKVPEDAYQAYIWALGPYMDPGPIYGPWAHMWALGPYMGPGPIYRPWSFIWALGRYLGPGHIFRRSAHIWAHI